MQTRIILFCYCFIVGLVAAMAWPANPAALPTLRIVTGVALAVAGALFLWAQQRMRSGLPAPSAARWRNSARAHRKLSLRT